MKKDSEVIVIDNDRELKGTIIEVNPDGTFIVLINNQRLRVYREDIKEIK